MTTWTSAFAIFHPTSQFPFTITANLPAGGTAKLEGKAGPINSADVSASPIEAQINVKGLDLTASGFVEPSTGIAGVADFDGTLNSDGQVLRTSGTLKAAKLKLAVKGTPATQPVTVKYATDYDLKKQGGTLTQGDVSLGKALAKLTGTYQSQGESTILNMKLNADGMPVDDLQAMLPALGIILPSGSKLQGGTLSVNVGITGPVDKLVIVGPDSPGANQTRGLQSFLQNVRDLGVVRIAERIGHLHPEPEHRCARSPRGHAHAEYQSDDSGARHSHGKRNHQPGGRARLQNEREPFRAAP